MTKKEFKTICRHEVYSGGNWGNRRKTNAFFFDYKTGTTADGKYFGGYKYMLSAIVKNMSKADLFNLAYNINEGIKEITEIPWYVNLKMVMFDELRFKVPLSIKL
jgi:hypothetical protein